MVTGRTILTSRCPGYIIVLSLSAVLAARLPGEVLVIAATTHVTFSGAATVIVVASGTLGAAALSCQVLVAPGCTRLTPGVEQQCVKLCRHTSSGV